MILKKAKLYLVLGMIAMKAISVSAQENLPYTKGAYNPDDTSSFRQYKCPEWFRDAKFGIWAHWGPQAVPRRGDWYVKKMYQQGSAINKYHVATYGHPSKFGYKDIIALWKAEKWDPKHLMELYKKAGAKYFVSMGSHHDNFFMWDSKIHRWNSVQMGPKKDVVKLWQQEAKKQGLRFGVSEHLAASYTWFQPSHGADTSGEMKGVPYDGNDTAYQDLYHTKAEPNDKAWLTTNKEWHKEWYYDVREVVDSYHPDLLYSDSKLPFGKVGLTMLANFYNGNMLANNGKLEAVYNCKHNNGPYVKDIERGVSDEISPLPWQTDTSIGAWFFQTNQKYKTAEEIIQMLTDIVSKNGNLLINVVQTPEGDIEQDMVKILEDIGVWTSANGEGIYASRPWKIYGEGPSTRFNEKGQFGGLKDTRKYEPSDFRFTTKKDVLYAFEMKQPEGDIHINSLGKKAGLLDKQIASIELLGTKNKLVWKQEDNELTITKPAELPKWSTLAFKIKLK